ncbi:L,D-peptidoglycan transpeptidase YkuD (ErfK/YbiS/YcfS/YnhG family) [Fusobacterium naviforme]|nr:L,D-peptidoglycan transpeptidase YkuD (ErfK/YbiS/YcfS/YnhG family) [Fusobacterium naviforme]STO26929.1 Uncharacterized protein conserved in bacteria [Fusobacterium naviforme]
MPLDSFCLSATRGGAAKILFYEKERDDNNAWTLLFETEGLVGKYGIDKTGEGDAKTPTGDFGVVSAFGIKGNPGTKLPYLPITDTTYACDEEGEYYNQIIDAKETGHSCNGEEMFKYSPEYNYGLTIDFNADNVYPDGSAVFIHCIGPKAFTGGCVALPEEYMKQVLEMAEPGMRIIINND